jgi:hypothetical protein
MVTTRKEEAELELEGAQSRLNRAEMELAFFFARCGCDRDATELHRLEIEVDESRRLVRLAREKVAEKN